MGEVERAKVAVIHAGIQDHQIPKMTQLVPADIQILKRIAFLNVGSEFQAVLLTYAHIDKCKRS